MSWTYEGRIRWEDAEPGIYSDQIRLVDDPDEEGLDRYLEEEIQRWLLGPGYHPREAYGPVRITVERLDS